MREYSPTVAAWKCSDISDRAVLQVLVQYEGKWASHFGGQLAEFFKPFPEKLGLAKMRQLLRRGLVSGCGCGCRGDWEITDKGRAFLSEAVCYPH